MAGSPPAGMATAIGLIPRILSRPPQGAIVGKALVVARPIMPSASPSIA